MLWNCIDHLDQGELEKISIVQVGDLKWYMFLAFYSFDSLCIFHFRPLGGGGNIGEHVMDSN